MFYYVLHLLSNSDLSKNGSILTHNFHTDKEKCTQAQFLHWLKQCLTVHSGPLSLLHGIKFNLSLVELVCDYKWARG